MPRLSLSSLRARVMVGVALVSCAVLALFGLRAFTEWDYRLDVAHTRVQKSAELRAAEQRAVLDYASAVIDGLLWADEVLPFAPSALCTREVEQALKQSPHFNSVAVLLPDGRTICGGVPATSSVKLADSPSFRRALLTTELVIGEILPDHAGSRFTLPLYRAAPAPDGKARGIVTIGVDLSSMTSGLVQQQFPAGSSVGIVDARGRVVTGTPGPEGRDGSDRASSAFFRQMQAADGKGSLDAVDPDGVRRIYGFARIADTDAGPLTLWIGIPQHAVLAEVNHDFIPPLGATFALIVLMFLAAVVGTEREFLRPVVALSTTAQRLAAGDLTARVKLRHAGSELGRLGHSLNALAYSLQAERRQQERTYRALRKLGDVVQRIPAVIAYVDREQRIQFANRSAAEWAGVDPEHVVGMTIRDAFGPNGFAKMSPFAEAALAGRPQSYALTFSDARDVLRQVDVVHIPDRSPQGVAGFLLFANDVTDYKAQEETLTRMAHLDALTGLPNRRIFEQLLAQAQKRARREGTWITVLFLDIDDFKAINDTYGHATGDAALQTFAARVKAAVRDVDVVARFGGDEFTVLLDDLRTPDAVQTVVGKIESSLAVPAEACGHALVLRASIGVARGWGSETAPERLLADADAAMYQAKNRRRSTRAETPATAATPGTSESAAPRRQRAE